MANKNVNAGAYKFHNLGGNWTEWNTAPGDYLFWDSDIICERFPTGPMRVSRATISVTVKPRYSYKTTVKSTLTAKLYKDDPETGTPITFLSKSNFEAGVISFDFTGLSFDVKDYIYIAFELDDEAEPSDLYSFYLSLPSTAAITYTNVPALTPSIILPSGTQNGAQGITFSWQTSGVGTQAKAELQWSTDGANWKALTTVGTAQTYTAPAAKFPTGTVYWRIKVTSSYDIESAWVQRSFSVQYPAASVTLTTPTSGNIDGGSEIPFAWTITQGGGSINGTQLDFSFDDGLTWTQIIDSSSAETRYDAAAGELPAGKLIWRVRVSDSYAGWSAYKQATVTVTYSAVSQVVPVNSPTSGIYNASSSRSFTVALQASSIVQAPFTVTAATMYWRAGESGNFTAVSMTPDGNQASVVIPAGTFPSGTIQWYAEATDNTDRTTQTETYTLTALNAAVEAAPVSPINTLESGSGPITFIWTYGSVDGSPQGQAEIQYSTDGGTIWTTLPMISGSETRAEIPAGTFPGGTITWRVRAYNEAGTAGPWSDPVSFISFSAPIVTGVLGDGKPFLTVSWQVDEQQAYEIEINGETYGPYYGENVRSFTLTEPLPDGSYIVRVRAQNRYGLWSEWAEGNVAVTNVSNTRAHIFAHDGVSVDVDLATSHLAPIITEQPQDFQTTDTSSPAIFSCGIVPRQKLFHWQVEWRENSQSAWQNATSVKTSGVGARRLTYSLDGNVLSSSNGNEFRFHIWNYRDEPIEVYSRAAKFTFAEPTMRSPLISGFFPPDYGYFLIYRDGELIGKTYEPSFIDRTVLGEHVYTAVQTLQDGYYAPNASVRPITGTASVKCPMIAPFENGVFTPLKLSENSRRAVSFSRHRQVAYTQYAGAVFPAAEIGENETITASFDVAYLQTDKAAADAFEALLGQNAILKSPGGPVVVGVLEGYDLNDMRFYKAYRCTLQQIDWGDFIDETGSV